MPPLDNRRTAHDPQADRTTARFRYAVEGDFTAATMPLGGAA